MLKTILQARIDPETRQRFMQSAQAQGISESELLRRLIHREIDSVQNVAASVEPDKGRADLTRTTVRLPAFILSAAEERAKIKGMVPSRWIASLVQSNVMRQPVLTDVEVSAVEASTRELSALGRNINQIARALNESPLKVERVRLDYLAELAELIKKNREAIRALVHASRSGWKED